MSDESMLFLSSPSSSSYPPHQNNHHGQSPPVAAAASNNNKGGGGGGNCRKPLQSLSINCSSTTPLNHAVDTHKTEKQSSITPLKKTSSEDSSNSDLEIPPRKTLGQVENNPLDQQQAILSIFRTDLWIDPNSEDEDELSLKRANPVYDDDDDFFPIESPSKRSKVTTNQLYFEDRLPDDITFLLSFDAMESS